MKKIEPFVSVLMPAYNAEQYIGEAIESILIQTYKNFEFIIIDDCSTDKTLEIIKSYSLTDKRIKYNKNKINLGIVGSRNKLVKLAKGKYIAWQDADDISFKDRLKIQCEFLEKHKDVGIVGGYLQFFNINGNRGVRKYFLKDIDLRKNIFKFSPVAQPCSMIRRHCFEMVGLYNINTPQAEDLDMSFRIGKFYKFANIGKILLKYREHQKSSTYSQLKKMELITLFIRKKYSKDEAYSYNFVDYIYNILHRISIYLVPSTIKIALFNLIRNK